MERSVKMGRMLVGLKSLFILVFIAALMGCGNNADEVANLKKELVKVNAELESIKGRYNAVSDDNKNLRDIIDDLNKDIKRLHATYSNTTENTESQYIEQISLLKEQIEQLNLIIIQQEQIIADQEAAFQEFMNMLGQPTSDLPTNY